MRSTSQIKSKSPERTTTKTSLLRGQMEHEEPQSFNSCLEDDDDERDDLPPQIDDTSNINSDIVAPESIAHSHPQPLTVVTSMEQAPTTIHASTIIPFAKTFTITESYRKKSPFEAAPLVVSTTSPLYTPPRRRARSTEGGMLRKEHNESELDTLLSASESEGVCVLRPSQHFIIPERSLNNGFLRLRKRNTKNTSSPSEGSTGNNQRTNQFAKRSHRSSKNLKARGKSKYVIPLEHPFKVVWDVFTVILSIAHSYLTHIAIRDREFGISPFIAFCDAWFFVDILLNFCTERRTNTGEILSDHRSIIARYLTSWFAVDALSLFPWEVLYIQPLIDVQNRRGILKKSFFRSKAVVRVTRHLRGRHFRWFGTVAKHTKHHGVGAQRLLSLIIKYIPKYWMFFRNMKGVVAIRFFRFIHWSRRFLMNLRFLGGERANANSPGALNRRSKTTSDASTKSATIATEDDDDDEDIMLHSDRDDDSVQNKSVEVVYDDFQMCFHDDDDYDDDDDDGVPL